MQFHPCRWNTYHTAQIYTLIRLHTKKILFFIEIFSNRFARSMKPSYISYRNPCLYCTTFGACRHFVFCVSSTFH